MVNYISLRERGSLFGQKFCYSIDNREGGQGSKEEIMDVVDDWSQGNPKQYIKADDLLDTIDKRDSVILNNRNSNLKITKEQEVEKVKIYKRIYSESQFDVTPENSFVKEFLEILSQIRLFHWQTYGYAEHTALGDYYDTFSGLADNFVESYQGQFGREYISGVQMSSNIGLTDIISHLDSAPDKVRTYVENTCIWLKEFRRNLETNSFDTSALQNIVDEMIGATDKLKHLLTLT